MDFHTLLDRCGLHIVDLIMGDSLLWILLIRQQDRCSYRSMDDIKLYP